MDEQSTFTVSLLLGQSIVDAITTTFTEFALTTEAHCSNVQMTLLCSVD